MARYVPPLSPVDIILVLIVALASVALAMLRSKEPGVGNDRSLADTAEPSERERLLRHYRRKWGGPDNVTDDAGHSHAPTSMTGQ